LDRVFRLTDLTEADHVVPSKGSKSVAKKPTKNIENAAILRVQLPDNKKVVAPSFRAATSILLVVVLEVPMIIVVEMGIGR
jgi:hypothetical protein